MQNVIEIVFEPETFHPADDIRWADSRRALFGVAEFLIIKSISTVVSAATRDLLRQ